MKLEISTYHCRRLVWGTPATSMSVADTWFHEGGFESNNVCENFEVMPTIWLKPRLFSSILKRNFLPFLSIHFWLRLFLRHAKVSHRCSFLSFFGLKEGFALSLSIVVDLSQRGVPWNPRDHPKSATACPCPHPPWLLLYPRLLLYPPGPGCAVSSSTCTVSSTSIAICAVAPAPVSTLWSFASCALHYYQAACMTL